MDVSAQPFRVEQDKELAEPDREPIWKWKRYLESPRMGDGAEFAHFGNDSTAPEGSHPGQG